ncbi:MAG: hypothetical protein FWG08_05110 [Propionibacteriaceae bacterium]|nr:hypothetical protein [Propionibacteriaceae bacterium]
MMARTTVAELGLKPPQVGVGAYVYPGEEQWGLSWWIGAPLWLWVDDTDTHQWGSHTLSVSEGGLTLNVVVKATQVSFNVGDGTPPVVCWSQGTPRPWNPNELMSKQSPSRCEHRYQTLNEQGNPDSRFTVSATVTWTATWNTTTGQAGSFTLDMSSTNNPTIHIGELRVVRVPNPPR